MGRLDVNAIRVGAISGRLDHHILDHEVVASFHEYMRLSTVYELHITNAALVAPQKLPCLHTYFYNHTSPKNEEIFSSTTSDEASLTVGATVVHSS